MKTYLMSAAKITSWRLVSASYTFAFTLWLTSNAALAAAAVIGEFGIKFGMNYAHEFVWVKATTGKYAYA